MCQRLPKTSARLVHLQHSLNLSYTSVVFHSQKSETESLYTALIHIPSVKNTTINFKVSEQSNCTPRCSQEVIAAGLPWLEHFRVQCYTQVKSLLVGLENKVHCYLATRPEVESLRVQSFVVSLKSFTLKGGASHQFINCEQEGTPSAALYPHALREYYYPEAQ